MDCWTVEEWLELVLDEAPHTGALAHAAECAGCGQVLDELRELIGALRPLRVAAPPAPVVERAAALLSRPGWIGRAIETLRAALVLDSWSLAPVAVRSTPASAEGVSAADSRYLRFESGSLAAELHTFPRGNGSWDMAGRLLESEAAAPFVVTAQGSRGVCQTRMSDDLGHFHFPSLPSDLYTLTIELDELELVLSPVPLEAATGG